jgi:hypothetical protein
MKYKLGGGAHEGCRQRPWRLQAYELLRRTVQPLADAHAPFQVLEATTGEDGPGRRCRFDSEII